VTGDEWDLAAHLADLADHDSVRYADDNDTVMAAYWQGWEDGLVSFLARAAAGVKVSCYPAGTCDCHPELVRGMR
jgi:hypothetical protein